MLKLGLPLTLIWMLSSAAGALDCLVNHGSNHCASDEYCATAAIQNGTGKYQSKLCVSSSACYPNNQTFSYNSGHYEVTALVHCCKTNNCNSEDVAYPGAQTNNSLQCFTCDDDDVCNKMVQCVGEQSHCFNVRDQNNTVQVLGCASANLCTLLQLKEQSALADDMNFVRAPACCGTSFCNSAATVSLSVVPVLLVLLFLIVY